MTFRLYNSYANSAGRRVRIALHLKDIPFEYVPIDIAPPAEEHLGEAFGKINPMRLIPALDHDGNVLIESMAILDYLEDLYPQPSLYPEESLKKAQAKAFAMTVAAGMHPLHNMRVIKYLGQELELDQKAVAKWYVTWADKGLHALETLVSGNRDEGPYCFGETPSIADLFLVPQYANYQNLGLNLTPYPHLAAIVDVCAAHPAFKKAAPENQPDFPSES